MITSTNRTLKSRLPESRKRRRIQSRHKFEKLRRALKPQFPHWGNPSLMVGWGGTIARRLVRIKIRSLEEAWEQEKGME